MGNKVGKTEVFYTFKSTNPKDLIEKLTKKLKVAQFVLKPQPSIPQDGPTLVFRESFSQTQLSDLCQESQRLRPNELMVVLTSEVNPRYNTTDPMVQLLCKTKGKSKSIEESEANSRNLRAIVEFLGRGDRRGADPQKSISIRRSISSSSSRPQQTGAEAAEDTHGTSARGGPVVHMAFGDQPDMVLTDAVKFVETKCQCRLVESRDIYGSSHLLVFCKNDTKLQEDIRHAIENTRAGADVMLLIVTDDPDLVLRDTEATQNLGAKVSLVFNHMRQKFSYGDNEKSLQWIKKFLGRHNIILTLHRARSFRRTWATLGKSEQMGLYVVLGDLSEEQLKNIVLYFDDLNVGLIETESSQSVRPLVLLCHTNQRPEQRLHLLKKSRRDLQDVFLVIIHRNSEEVPLFRTLTDVNQGKLATDDLSADVMDSVQNKRLGEAVRKFLKKRTAPSQRPTVHQIFDTSDSAVAGDEAAQCSTADSARVDPEGVEVKGESDYFDVDPRAADAWRTQRSLKARPELPDLHSVETWREHVPQHRPSPAHEHSSPTMTQPSATQGYHPILSCPQEVSGSSITYVREPHSSSTENPHRSHQPSAYSSTFSQVSPSSVDGQTKRTARHSSLRYVEGQESPVQDQAEGAASTVSQYGGSGEASHPTMNRESWARRRMHPRHGLLQASQAGQRGDRWPSFPAGSSELETAIY